MRRAARKAQAATMAAVAMVAWACASGDPARTALSADDGCRPEVLATATQPVEVVVWHTLGALRGGRASSPFADLATAFNRSQDKARVRVETFSSWEDMERRLFSLAPDDPDLPDLVELTWGANRAAIDSGRVAPVQACLDASGYDLSDFVPQALALTRLEGRQWGLPIGHYGHLLLYDKGAFVRASLDPERPPATLADLRRAAEALKAAGVAHPLATRLVNPLFWTATVTTDMADGHDGRPTEVTFASDATRRVMHWAKALIEDQLAIPPTSDGRLVDDLMAIGRGQSAMTIHASLELKDVTKALAQGQAPAGFTLGVAALPTLDGPGVSLANAGSFFLGRASSPEERAGAWSFLEWFESPAQQARWHETSFFFPTRLSAARHPAVVALWAREPELAEGWAAATGPLWPLGSLVGASTQIEAEFDRALADVIDHGKPVDETLQSAAQRANRLLAHYNADLAGFIRCHYARNGCRP